MSRKQTQCLIGALAALAVLVSGAASAHAEHRGPASGPYVSLYGGASFLKEAENQASGAPDITSEFDTGFVVGGTLGFYASHGFVHSRAELDVNYRRHGVDEVSTGGVSVSADGDIGTLGVLANYWLDIENRTPLTPYLGGGVGFAYISANDVEAAGVDIVDDTDVVLAWQLGTGLIWRLSPSMALSADYRWFVTGDPEFRDAGGSDFDSEYSTHNIMAGIRFDF